jgi:hypothetical protein
MGDDNIPAAFDHVRNMVGRGGGGGVLVGDRFVLFIDDQRVAPGGNDGCFWRGGIVCVPPCETSDLSQ